MYKFNEYNVIKENYNQLKSIVKTKSKEVENGYGTPTGIERGSDDYQFLSLLISPDENYKTETKNDIYGDIPVNIEKEKTMRPFLGMMAKMYYEEKCDLNIIQFLTNWILNNKQHLNRLMIKNNNTNETFPLSNLLDVFKFKTQFNDGRPSYEILTDAIRDKGGVDNVKNWINRLPAILKNGFKNETNYNELSKLVKSFETIPKEGQNSILTSLFGDGQRTGKISRFKSSEEFLKALKIDIKNYQTDWNIDIVKEQISKVNSAKLIVCDYEKNYIVADIWDYKASNLLGETNNWCISYSPSHWYNTYMNYDSGNKMFFIWNFNVDMSDKYSHLGICMQGYEYDDSNKIENRACHDKYDNSIDLDVLDSLDIDKSFIYTQKLTEEEYLFKKKEYNKWKILETPFNRYMDMDEAKKKAKEIADLYNIGDIDDVGMVDVIYKLLLKIKNTEIVNYIIDYFFKKCNLQPVNLNNNIVTDYLEDYFTINENNKKIVERLNKLFNLYSVGLSYISKEILEFLEKYCNNIYVTYFNKIKKELKNYNENNSFIDRKTIKENIEIFINDSYDLLLKYVIDSHNVNYLILQIFQIKNSFISDLIDKDYSFESDDILTFLEHYDYDLSDIKITDEELENILTRCDRNSNIELKNFNNLVVLLKSNNKDIYDAEYNVNRLEFLIQNGVNLDNVKWHLRVEKDASNYSSQKSKFFLENNADKINIYKEYKKGNITIENKSFYYNHIIDYIFKNDLPIDNNKMFIDSLLNQRNLENTPIKYVPNVIDLFLKNNIKIPADLAKIALENNNYDSNIVIDNLDYTDSYDYNSGNNDIIETLFAYDNPYIDKIMSKLPNLESYDMDDVGIYVKNVKTINKLLNICKKPKEDLLYYILNYAYETDNKVGDVGDNEETIQLVNRLVKKGYDFDFSKSYRNIYFIFEKLSLFLLKDFITKKYFDIQKLDIEKVCISVLKQNNIELYNYIKSLLPENSFKIEYLSSNPKREIIDDILTWDSEYFMDIFPEITSSEDYIYYYDKFYPKMTEENKNKIINSLLISWSIRSAEVKDRIKVLNHLINYEENREFVKNNWEDNKRRKNYTDEVREWIKNYLNPPKVRVKKIKEMFSFNFPKIKKA